MYTTGVINFKRDTIFQVWYRSCPNVEKVRTRQTHKILVTNGINFSLFASDGHRRNSTMSMIIHG